MGKLFKDEWILAIRKRQDKLMFEERETRGFQVIKNTLKYWCADPFLVTAEGRDYVFFEAFNRLTRKGEIGYRDITDGIISDIKIVFRDNCHLSYPHIFLSNGEFFMIPEASGGGTTYLLKATKFPNKWEKVDTIFDGKYCDTTLIVHGRAKYLFTTPIIKDNVSVLEIYNYRDNMWVANANNPIIENKSIARMAGNFISIGDDIIRVSQNCDKEYGGGLNFSKITTLSTEEYREQLIRTVSLADFESAVREKFDGIHTYNYNDEVEIIDFKKNHVFKFTNLIGCGIKKIFRK